MQTEATQNIESHRRKLKRLNQEIVDAQRVWDEFNEDTSDVPRPVRRAKQIRAPRQPTEREREEHEVTHMPYKAWCDACVKGRAVAPHH